MRRSLLVAIVVVWAWSLAAAAPPESRGWFLYKFAQQIGREDVLTARDPGGTEIRSVFTFTDRTTPVPLAAILRLGPDGAPQRMQIWGSTSRGSEVDDLVIVSGKTLAITQRGETRTVNAPPAFFVASGYAPVAITEELLRYWQAHGSPARLPVFPMGEVTVARRGEDKLVDDEGKERTLVRYALGGMVWGHEIVWLDEKGHVAALKGVDAEFDHFEAIATGWRSRLDDFIRIAAADGMASLLETSQAVRADSAAPGVTAYSGARLIDATGAPAIDDAVVVVEGDKIVAAGPRAKVAIPPGARTVDLAGKTILPGLWDMHAHFEQVEWGPLYLAAGVTTVRDCGNELEFISSVRDAIEAGKGVGPRLLLACIVDGQGAGAIGTSRLRSAEEIPALIQKFRAARCSQVKIYSSLDPKLIAPLAKAAHAAGMTVTGHVPSGIGAVNAVKAGFDMINHSQFILRAFLAPGENPDLDLKQPVWEKAIAEANLDTPAAKKTAAFFAAHKTVIDDTFALMELYSRAHDEMAKLEPGLGKVAAPLAPAFATFGAPPEMVEKGRVRLQLVTKLIGMLHKAGVIFVAGTDQAVPGHSLHRELELYVEAGFTPMEAIQAATIVPARAMKKDKELGTIQPGKRADLIVLDGDPLADIHATRKVTLVVAAGVAYDPAKLWRSVGFQP